MRQIAEHIYLETAYPGVNVLALATRKGIICIDTPTFPHDARAWVTRVRKLFPYKISFLVLSDLHGDRILNCRWFNAPIIVQHQTEIGLQQYDKRYPQTIIESLVARNPDCRPDLLIGPVEQPDLSFGQELTLGNDPIKVEFIHMPGPAAGTIWAHFPQAGILFTGDSVVNGEHPCLATAECESWLESLDRLLHDERLAEVHTIVPGRGMVCDRSAVPPVSAYIQEALDYVQHHAQSGNPRDTLKDYVPVLAHRFPTGRWPRSWTYKQIRIGLEHLYDQIQLKAQLGSFAPQGQEER